MSFVFSCRIIVVVVLAVVVVVVVAFVVVVVQKLQHARGFRCESLMRWGAA